MRSFHILSHAVASRSFLKRLVRWSHSNVDERSPGEALRELMRQVAQPIAIVTVYLPTPTDRLRRKGSKEDVEQTPAPSRQRKVEDHNHGATLSSLSSISLSPPLVAFSLRLPSRLGTHLLSKPSSSSILSSSSSSSSKPRLSAKDSKSRLTKTTSIRKDRHLLPRIRLHLLTADQEYLARIFAGQPPPSPSSSEGWHTETIFDRTISDVNSTFQSSSSSPSPSSASSFPTSVPSPSPSTSIHSSRSVSSSTTDNLLASPPSPPSPPPPPSSSSPPSLLSSPSSSTVHQTELLHDSKSSATQQDSIKYASEFSPILFEKLRTTSLGYLECTVVKSLALENVGEDTRLTEEEEEEREGQAKEIHSETPPSSRLFIARVDQVYITYPLKTQDNAQKASKAQPQPLHPPSLVYLNQTYREIKI